MHCIIFLHENEEIKAVISSSCFAENEVTYFLMRCNPESQEVMVQPYAADADKLQRSFTDLRHPAAIVIAARRQHVRKMQGE